MWQRLHDGFVRGRTNRRPDLTLSELSASMHENQGYMRVYWSGAWYFLTADLELRRRSRGRQSLDTALRALNVCCADRKLSAREIARRLDAVADETLFLPLFEEVVSRRALPAFEDQFMSLGINVHSGEVVLDETHESASLRRSFARWGPP
jgi:predicted metalloprotease with PDZ domain